ncbi:MAG: hypothetical protein RLZZ232_143 [Planctomycetota bacterium]
MGDSPGTVHSDGVERGRNADRPVENTTTTGRADNAAQIQACRQLVVNHNVR